MKKKSFTYNLQKGELKALENIRKIAVISLFSDDYLMDIFALKGGSAINIGYGLHYRESIDIDISMEEDFSKANVLYTYALIKSINGKLKTKFKKELKKGAKILSDVFSIKEWGGKQSIDKPNKKSLAIYIYEL